MHMPNVPLHCMPDNAAACMQGYCLLHKHAALLLLQQRITYSATATHSTPRGKPCRPAAAGAGRQYPPPFKLLDVFHHDPCHPGMSPPVCPRACMSQAHVCIWCPPQPRAASMPASTNTMRFEHVQVWHLRTPQVHQDAPAKPGALHTAPHHPSDSTVSSHATPQQRAVLWEGPHVQGLDGQQVP